MTNLATVPTSRPGRYGIRQAVAGEVTKLATLRSTTWTLIVTVVGTLGVTYLATRRNQAFDPTNQSMTGLVIGALTLGVLGVLSVTGEHASGTIRSSLAAIPRRPLLLWAKILVVAGLALVVGELITFSAFGVGQAVFASSGAPHAHLGQPGVLRALVLSGVFLALLALAALGLGTIFRHTAGALAAYVGLIFLLPIIVHRLPGNLERYLPEQILANSVAAVVPQHGQLTAPVGTLLMAGYTVAVLAVGAALLARRDA